MLKKITTYSAIVLISALSVVTFLSLPSEARNRCRGLGQHLDPTMQCNVTEFTAQAPIPSSRPGIAEIQRVHHEVIGVTGGNAYVATAQNMLANGKTLRDVRIYLIDNFSEAAIQRVHTEVIGVTGGRVYVADAKAMLADGKTLRDVRIYLIDKFSEAAIQRVHNEVIGGNGGPAYVATAKAMLTDGKTLRDVREYLIRNFKR
ncbi:hypothetical protein [Planktothrix sp. FACHB-1355]|nr:hypothetical protein [Planktothrix sp. FACHB-1355]